MGALRPKSGRTRVKVCGPCDRRGTGGGENNDMRDRAGGRRAAKRAGFKVRVRSGMVVMQVPRHRDRRGRAQLQRERHAAGRHEATGNVGAEQEQGQQPNAGP
jgi:hypothetical protein